MLFDLSHLKNPELTICLQQAHSIVCLVKVAVLNVQGRGVIAIIGHGNLAILKVLKWMIIQQNARLTLSHGLRAAAVDV